MKESGFPQFVMRDWKGIIACAGTPREAVQALNAALNRAMALPKVRAQLFKMGNDPVTGTPEQFGELIAADAERWAASSAAAPATRARHAARGGQGALDLGAGAHAGLAIRRLPRARLWSRGTPRRPRGPARRVARRCEWRAAAGRDASGPRFAA